MLLFVLTPQPAGNQNQMLNRKREFLLIVIDDEVVGQVFLLMFEILNETKFIYGLKIKFVVGNLGTTLSKPALP